MQGFGEAEGVAALRKAGVVGTFSGQPVHRKLGHATATLLVNAVEAEPGFTVDTLLLERNAREIGETIRRIREFGFRKVVVAVADWTAEEGGGLLDRADELGFSIAEVPGEEGLLPEADLARVALRRVTPAATAEEMGVTVVNLETLYHVYRALFRGRPMVTKVVQLAGSLDKARVFEVPLGALVEDVARLADVDPQSAEVFGVAASDRARGWATPAEARHSAVGKTTDAILLLDREREEEAAYALELMGPAEAIEDVTGRFGRLELTLGGAHGALVPAVAAGATVRKGQVLASPPPGEDGVDLHAPLDARVVGVGASLRLEVVR